jgi:hypothetical protein
LLSKKKCKPLKVSTSPILVFESPTGSNLALLGLSDDGELKSSSRRSNSFALMAQMVISPSSAKLPT